MDYNNILALTDTEFFQQLTERKNDNIHIAYKQFVVEVNNFCHRAKSKMVAINALIHVEVEISHLQTQAQRDALNEELVNVIVKSLRYVRQTLSNIKEIEFVPSPDEEIVSNLSLTWKWGKTALAELCHALRVGQCFGKAPLTHIVKVVEKAFNEKLDISYVRNRISNLKCRGKKSSTDCLDRLLSCLNSIAYDPSDDPSDDEEEAEEVSA